MYRLASIRITIGTRVTLRPTLTSTTLFNHRSARTHTTEIASSPDISAFQDSVCKLQSLYSDISRANNGRFPLISSKQEQYFASNNNRILDREAAVLVLLCNVGDQPSLLFTKRSSNLNAHASEISFPGGHYEADVDATLQDTALREAQEELLPNGFDMNTITTVFGNTSPIPSLKGTPVTAILAYTLHTFADNTAVSKAFPGERDEVDVVFTVSLQELIDNETVHELPKNRFGLEKAPVFVVGHEHGEIWGLTSFILRPYLHKLLKPAFRLVKRKSTTVL